MVYVYVLKSRKDGSVYIGRTEDLRRRLREHNNGESKATKSRMPFDLVYYEATIASIDAVRREMALKRFSGAFTHLKKRIAQSLIIFK